MNLAKWQDTKSIHRSLEFLYNNNEKSERAIKESIPFTIATKRIKYLGIKLPKETKDLYTENNKTLVKERRHKQVERYSMFPGRKNQYCENDYSGRTDAEAETPILWPRDAKN